MSVKDTPTLDGARARGAQAFKEDKPNSPPAHLSPARALAWSDGWREAFVEDALIRHELWVQAVDVGRAMLQRLEEKLCGVHHLTPPAPEGCCYPATIRWGGRIFCHHTAMPKSRFCFMHETTALPLEAVLPDYPGLGA